MARKKIDRVVAQRKRANTLNARKRLKITALDIAIGREVRDRASGFVGMITARHDMINGCTHWSIRPKVDAKNEMAKQWRMDGFTLEVTGPGMTDELPAEDTDVLIGLGDQVRDRISGFIGVVTEKYVSMNGCVEFLVTGKLDRDGRPVEVYLGHKHLVRYVDGVAEKSSGPSETGSPPIAGPDTLSERVEPAPRSGTGSTDREGRSW